MINKIINEWVTPFFNFLNDAPEPWQLGFQDAASPIMEEVIYLHDQIMFILVLIITTVL